MKKTVDKNQASSIDGRHQDLWDAYTANPEDGDVLCRLMEVYQPFVRGVLGRMAIQLPSHVAIEDLLQAAMIGLFQAIERFDAQRGMKFESFAYRRVRGAILDELRSMDYLSRTCRGKVRKVEQVIQEWMQEFGYAPSDEELAEKMGMTLAELHGLMDRAQPWVSLDETILSGDRRRMTRQDVVEDNHAIHPDRETIRQDNLERLRKAFLQLSSREQKILYLYYFEELRLSEIAQLYELTEARICQIHAMAAAKLKVILATDNGG